MRRPTVASVLRRKSRRRDALPLLVCDDERLSHAEADRRTAELSAYKIPKRFAVMPCSDIPLLSSGKVDIQFLAGVFDA